MSKKKRPRDRSSRRDEGVFVRTSEEEGASKPAPPGVAFALFKSLPFAAAAGIVGAWGRRELSQGELRLFGVALFAFSITWTAVLLFPPGHRITRRRLGVFGVVCLVNTLAGSAAYFAGKQLLPRPLHDLRAVTDRANIGWSIHGSGEPGAEVQVWYGAGCRTLTLKTETISPNGTFAVTVFPPEYWVHGDMELSVRQRLPGKPIAIATSLTGNAERCTEPLVMPETPSEFMGPGRLYSLSSAERSSWRRVATWHTPEARRPSLRQWLAQ